MRIVVAIAVEVGILAVVLQGGVEPTVAGAALVLAPAGCAFSYTRRRRSGIVIKVILAAGLLLALDWFIGRVRFATTIDQARIPLASLFVWVQVLHSFDVPRRRDLAFSMVSSTTLIAAAGAIALTTSFVWILLVWAALAAAWLWLSARPSYANHPENLFTLLGRRYRMVASEETSNFRRLRGEKVCYVDRSGRRVLGRRLETHVHGRRR